MQNVASKVDKRRADRLQELEQPPAPPFATDACCHAKRGPARRVYVNFELSLSHFFYYFFSVRFSLARAESARRAFSSVLAISPWRRGIRNAILSHTLP